MGNQNNNKVSRSQGFLSAFLAKLSQNWLFSPDSYLPLNRFSYNLKMPRGGKRGHKGGRRSFTNPGALEAAKEKEEKEKAWRRQRGEIIESDEDSDAEDKKSSGDEDGVAFKQQSSSESSSESEDEERKPKGAEGLIEIENPNRVKPKQKKVTALDTEGNDGKPQLSRREREEL